MSFCMMNNCTVEIIPASADATALLAAFSSLALSVSAFGEVLSCDAIFGAGRRVDIRSDRRISFGQMPLISSAFSYFLAEYARLFIGGWRIWPSRRFFIDLFSLTAMMFISVPIFGATICTRDLPFRLLGYFWPGGLRHNNSPQVREFELNL